MKKVLLILACGIRYPAKLCTSNPKVADKAKKPFFHRYIR